MKRKRYFNDNKLSFLPFKNGKRSCWRTPIRINLSIVQVYRSTFPNTRSGFSVITFLVINYWHCKCKVLACFKLYMIRGSKVRHVISVFKKLWELWIPSQHFCSSILLRFLGYFLHNYVLLFLKSFSNLREIRKNRR